MCRRSARSFCPGYGSPAAARAFVRAELAAALLAGPAVQDPSEDAALVVSELVTNAVNAGSTVVEVDLTVHHARLVLVVGDDAPGWPRLVTAGPSERRHRGLRLVEALSQQWTVQPRAGSGKNVMAEIGLPVESTAELACEFAAG